MNFIGLLAILFLVHMYKNNEKKIVKFHKNLGKDLLFLEKILRGLSNFLTILISLPFICLRKLLGLSKDIPQEESVKYAKVVNIFDYSMEGGKAKKRKTI